MVAKSSEPSKPTKKERSAKQKESLEKANKIRAEKLKIWKAEKAKAEEEGKDFITWNRKAYEKKKKRTDEDALYDTILKAIDEREEKKKEEEARKAECFAERSFQRKKPIKNKTLKNRNNYRINKIQQEETLQIKPLPTKNSYINDNDKEDSYSSDSDSLESTDLKVKEELWKQTQQEIGGVFLKNKIVNEFIKQQKTLEPEYKPLPPPPAPPPAPAPERATKEDLELVKQEIIKQHQIKQQQERQEIIRRQEEQKQQIKQIPHPKQENTTIGLITNTKINQKAVLEPPKYTTDINTVYNPQTLNSLQSYSQQLPIIKDTKISNKPVEPNLFRENQLRELMGLKQIERPRYEPENKIKYTTGSPALDRLLNK